MLNNWEELCGLVCRLFTYSVCHTWVTVAVAVSIVGERVFRVVQELNAFLHVSFFLMLWSEFEQRISKPCAEVTIKHQKNDLHIHVWVSIHIHTHTHTQAHTCIYTHSVFRCFQITYSGPLLSFQLSPDLPCPVSLLCVCDQPHQIHKPIVGYNNA